MIDFFRLIFDNYFFINRLKLIHRQSINVDFCRNSVDDDFFDTRLLMIFKHLVFVYLSTLDWCWFFIIKLLHIFRHSIDDDFLTLDHCWSFDIQSILILIFSTLYRFFGTRLILIFRLIFENYFFDNQLSFATVDRCWFFVTLSMLIFRYSIVADFTTVDRCWFFETRSILIFFDIRLMMICRHSMLILLIHDFCWFFDIQ